MNVFFPGRSDHQLVGAGRIAAGAALLASIALVPLLDRYGSLFVGLNDIIAHIAPPVTTIFLLGVLLPSATALSARWTLWLGSALGAGVFALNKLVPDNPLAAIPFMLMAFYLLVACLALQVALTLAVPGERAANGLSWRTPAEAFAQPAWRGWGNYRLLTAAVFGLFGILYWIFK